SEDIKVHVDGVGANPVPRDVTIPATLTSVGAVISIAPLSRDFSTTTSFGGTTFTITNDGNKIIYLHHALSGTNAQTGSGSTSAVNPTSTHDLTFGFSPSQNGNYAATISTTRADSPWFSFFPTSMRLCNPPVPDLTLTGHRVPPPQ